ncbi:SusC/RagA family TonB-linked outer membrane protein [Dyadobacter endophyticus]|uniref:SusC/RagA family TonB-linked outer membrane protein n=1 Tax=Dyadobacter endophyticus TaxID=1749036 RepID=A0ABQ1Z4F5_9BACT|nr:TonB-dependent receptor [Dyadobacter endophyticus]GGH48530.1 SusC/RagA family TonB-linked outer membrane protein [Dyadobacter endophyticus]
MTPRLLFTLIFVSLFLSVPGYSQQATVASGDARRVSGTVSDIKGGGIPGANVSVVGTTTGVITDAKGMFSVDVPNSQAVLRFSFIGYKTTEVTVGNKNQFSITMEEDSRTLDQLVVVGYGTQKKKDLTGAVSSIGNESLNLGGATSNVAQAFQGRAAGVQVSQSNSAPGGSTVVRVRGGNSISSTNEPLYVVDGFPSETGKEINPNDIDDIQILKDASATAIYGARGANGVVIITTKRGKTGKPTVTLDSYYGIQKVASSYDKMTGLQAMQITNAKNQERGLPPTYTPTDLASGTNTDWFKLATRDAKVQSYSLTASGGNEDTRVALSLNYFSQDGALKNTDYDRYSIRLNLDKQFGKRFKMGANMYGAHTFSMYKNYDGNIQPSNVMYGILSASPAIAAYNADGTYARFQGRDNSIAWLLEPVNHLYGNKININTFIEYQFTDALSFKVNAGTEYNASKEGTYLPRTLVDGEKVRGRATVQENTAARNLVEGYFTYVKTFGAHFINAVAGVSMQDDIVENHFSAVQNFSTDAFLYNNLGAGTQRVLSTSSKTNTKIASAYGRINYAFKDKYLATFTIRRDGSSRFGPNNRYGYFPSGSVAWRLGDEDFVKNLNVFSDLKLRASYGVTGNDRIGDYAYMTTFSPVNVTLDGNNSYGGTAASRLPNPDLKWESTAQLDIGADVAFGNGRISATFDYYRKKTKDLLLNIPVGDWWGFTTQIVNAGSIQNSGLELSLNTQNIAKGSFRWKSSFNIGYNKQKVLNLGGRPYIITQTANPYGGRAIDFTKLEKGQELSSFFGYKYAGVIKTGETYTPQPGAPAGSPKYVDVNNDGKLDANDRAYLGNANPHYIYGIGNEFRYKNFDLNIFMQGALGYSLFNGNGLVLESGYGTAALNRWTPDNQNTDIPRDGYATTSYGSYINDRFVEDASFLRCKMITLGYNLPIGTAKKLNVRVYGTIQNLFTITNYTGTDPESNTRASNSGTAAIGGTPPSAVSTAAINLASGLDYTAFPSYRSYTLGLKINF